MDTISQSFVVNCVAKEPSRVSRTTAGLDAIISSSRHTAFPAAAKKRNPEAEATEKGCIFY